MIFQIKSSKLNGFCDSFNESKIKLQLKNVFKCYVLSNMQIEYKNLKFKGFEV